MSSYRLFHGSEGLTKFITPKGRNKAERDTALDFDISCINQSA